jgi:hypothetical protein
MIDDPILRDIRRVREERAAAFGYDIRRMLRDLKAKQQAAETQGVKFIRLPLKRPEPMSPRPVGVRSKTGWPPT